MSERTGRGHERIDEGNCGGDFARASYKAMATSSRHLGTTRAVQRFIRKEIDELEADRPLRVLDVGAGACDVAEDVCRWARHRSLRVHFTCVDANEYAVARARQRLRQLDDCDITVRQERIQEYTSEVPFDCAVGSLFFHHFQPDEILGILSHLRRFVSRSVFINDLRRSSLAFFGFLALAPTLPPGVWHDGLNSIRRGFEAEELGNLLETLPGVEVETRNEFLFRVTARIRFLR